MTLPLGKHSGRHAFARACEQAGIELGRLRAPGGLHSVQAACGRAQGRDPVRRLRGGAGHMKRQKRYTVACLSGDGIGPELMAEASRALAEAGRLHGFFVDEVHAPFAGEAVSRHGHPLPVVAPGPPAAWPTQCSSRSRASPRSRASRRTSTSPGASSASAASPDGDIAIVSPLVDEARALRRPPGVRPRPLPARERDCCRRGRDVGHPRSLGGGAASRASRSSGSR